MPGGWSAKDERMYEHIKQSAKRRGGAKRAREIAARTVNKHRREEGRTPNKKTEGTGNPNIPLEQRSVQELKNMAAERKVRGRSKMRKQQLVDVLKRS